MRATGTCILAGLVLSCLAARAAESSATDPQAQQAARATARADLTAVIKVTGIADPKPEAEAKDKEAKEDEKKEQQPAPVMPLAVQPMRNTAEKLVAAEVVEAVRGQAGEGPLTIRVRLMEVGKRSYLMFEHQMAVAGGGIARTSRSVPNPFAAGKQCLVFLKLAEEKKDAEGKVTARIYELTDMPLAGPPEKALAGARQAVKELAAWDKPPALSEEDQAAVAKLIGELGSSDYATREAANKALVAKGPAVKAPVEAALKSEDLEVKQRARSILEALKPECLREPSGAAGRTIQTPDGRVIILRQGGAAGGVVQFQVQAGAGQ